MCFIFILWLLVVCLFLRLFYVCLVILSVLTVPLHPFCGLFVSLCRHFEACCSVRDNLSDILRAKARDLLTFSPLGLCLVGPLSNLSMDGITVFLTHTIGRYSETVFKCRFCLN